MKKSDIGHHVNCFWIIGAGQFGKRAAKMLNHMFTKSNIVVVDNDLHQLEFFDHSPIRTICEEGVSYLAQKTHMIDPDEWIVPAVPTHFAFEFIRLKLIENYDVKMVDIPKQLDALLPNPIHNKKGQLLTSNADFICPPNCSEPYDICSHTGKARPRILFEAIRDLNIKDFHPIVIQSRQIAPGVGGYTFKDLNDAQQAIIGHKGNVLLSSACFCHGVINSFGIQSK